MHDRLFPTFLLGLLLAACVGASACGRGSGDASIGKPSNTQSQTSGSASGRSRAQTSSPGPISNDYDNDDTHPPSPLNDADDDDKAATDGDGDADNSSNSYFDRDDSALKFGHAASGPQAAAISALVRRYTAAAAHEDGAAACAMLASSLAGTVVETLGGSAGPSFSRGSTCAAVLTKTFTFYHRQLGAHAAALRALDVRIRANEGVAVLSYGKPALPGRFIRVERTRGAWRVDQLLDEELP